MSDESQNNQILRHLQAGKSITPMDALRLYGSLRLSARIWQLRQKGNPISVRIIPTLTGKRVAEYYLKQTK